MDFMTLFGFVLKQSLQ